MNIHELHAVLTAGPDKKIQLQDRNQASETWLPGGEKTLVENEGHRCFDNDSREIGMLWAQQVIMFKGHNFGADRKNSRSATVDPSVAEGSLIGSVPDLLNEVCLFLHENSVGNDGRDHDIASELLMSPGEFGESRNVD